MKTLAIALGVLATAAATAVPAQNYYYRTYDARVDQECWNPRAGHFEAVRPGEYQGDLDFNRCRLSGDRGDRADRREWRQENRQEARQECWNPRARHFEEVRSGETQDDLDFSRCRYYR